ncbi:MAG: methyltransferase domain-containing protein [Acidimicrobiales bacterium]
MLDLACGTGDLCRELSAAGVRPVGMDLSYGMLAAARTDAALVQADALALPVADGGVDGVTCGFAAQPRRPASVLRRARARRATGRTRRCSRWPNRPTRCCAPGTPCTSARWCR